MTALARVFRTEVLELAAVDGSNVPSEDSALRAKTILVSGTLTANANLILPLREGVEWFVENGTTGGYALVVKGASGTGVTVAAGDLAIVVCDGTNFRTVAGTGTSAPTDAQYIVGASNGTLSAERVATTTTTIAYDAGTAGQAKWNLTANWGAFSWTSTGTATLGGVNVTGLTASRYVVTDASKNLASQQGIPLTDLGNAGGANGDVLYHNGTNWVRLAAGTNGHVLTLAAGIPSWAAASGGATEDPLTTGVADAGSIESTVKGTDLTSSSTITVGSVTPPDSCSGDITIIFTATKSDHAASYSQAASVGFKKVSGTCTVFGGTTLSAPLTDGDTSGIDVDIDASGGTLRVRATGRDSETFRTGFNYKITYRTTTA